MKFVLLGEVHNYNEMNEFALGLFNELHDRAGFRYVVVEQDPLISERYGSRPFRSDVAAIAADAAHYPHALHFYGDSEISFLAAVGKKSKANTSPLWGVDRTFSVQLALEELRKEVKNKQDRQIIDEILSDERAHKNRVFSEFPAGEAVLKRFLGEENAAFDALLNRLKFKPGSRGDQILFALKESRENYRAYFIEHDEDDPWGYHLNRQREALMKANFARHYLAAKKRGEDPKAIVKMGGAHTMKGKNHVNTYTLGNALTGAEALEGARSLNLQFWIANAPGGDWTVTDDADIAFMHAAVDTNAWTLIDVRPLRGHLHSGRFRLPKSASSYIFSADMFVLLGGAERVSHDWIDQVAEEGWPFLDQ